MRFMSVDIETYSSADLPSCGVYRYASSPDFEILIIGYSFDGGPVQVHDCTEPGPWPEDFLEALTDPEVEKRAWNAPFERTCLAAALGKEMPPEQWSDSMVVALECGLPGSLAGAGIALGLPEDKLKDPIGKSLIQYFSKPCRATKSNNGRTRNLPGHDREKWKLYIEYNRQDVVTEMAIRQKLDRYKLAESEQHLWELDQRMNDRGVRLDVPMINVIVAHDEQNREKLQAEAREITGLSNPNSLSQLKPWLQSRGVNAEALRKDDVAKLLAGDLPEDVRRALEIRQALGKTSVAKYHAMQDAVCPDGRLRGILQFYGANRSGRWAGRIVQTHNLARNSLPDLYLARELAAEDDFETMELLFGETSFVLSELIRTAFIPSEGRRFVVSDFSAIEARVLAWLAGEDWVLDAFRNGKDIYCETASMMYHVPVVKHGVNGELRQKGKIATLACIAEGQQVLTDQGLIPIEQVTKDMKVWDGVEWVNHDGVVCRGEREVMSYGGLEATPDHIVWAEIDGVYRQVRFGDAAFCGSRLVQSGAGREAVRLAEDNFSGTSVYEGLERVHGAYGMHRMRQEKLDLSVEYDAVQNERLSELQPAQGGSTLAGPETDCGEAAMRKSSRSAVHELWGQGDPLRLPKCDGRVFIHDRELRTAGQEPEAGDRQDRQQRQLCSGKPEMGDQERTEFKQTDYGAQQIRSGELAIRKKYSAKETVAGSLEGRDHPGGGDCCIREAEELAWHPRTVRVYDIRNAGRRHRFTVSGVLVHNCGYQGGVGAMKAMDREGAIPEEELQAVVEQWRTANPKIVKLWRTCELAAKAAIRERRPVKINGGRITIGYINGNLFIRLPNGRKLCYWQTRLKEDPETGREQIVYMGVNQTTKQWGETETYGGKIVENITQATARDCLAEAMTRVTAMGYEIVMHVHDEMIVDVPLEDTDALKTINKAMSDPIDWAPGLPLKGDGYECAFYMKD